MRPYLAEFVGTALLVLFGNGAVANVVLSKSKGQGGGWIVIAAGWGCAVAIAVYVVVRISGAHINPAVTVALASIGGFDWHLVPGYVLSQLAGAFFGSVLVFLAYFAHWGATDDQAAKLACYCNSPAIRRLGSAFVTELIGTATLVFVVLAMGRVSAGAAVGQETWVAAMGTWFGPAVVGLLVFAIGLSLGGPTGFTINPARDLGPRIAHAVLPIPGKGSSDWAYALVPVVAPLIGGVSGAFLFKFLGF